MDSFLVNAAGGESSDTSSSSSRSIQYQSYLSGITSAKTTEAVGCDNRYGCSFSFLSSEEQLEPGVLFFPSFTVQLGSYIGESSAYGVFSIATFVGSLTNLSSSGYQGTYTDGVCGITSYGKYTCTSSYKPSIVIPSFYVLWASPSRTRLYQGYQSLEFNTPHLAIVCISSQSESSSGLAAYMITEFSITAKFMPIQSLFSV